MRKILLLLIAPLILFANEFILAIQWYPSVCKVKQYPTCKKMIPFWKENFTLHGLWPKKKEYCNIPARFKILDKKRKWQHIPLQLPQKIEELLVLYMPGSLTGLHKHEWVKHGSCYNKPPELYFLESIYLTSQVNESKVRDFFINNRGKRVQTIKIRKLFDKEFGNSAGKKVKFICKKGYITELRLNLKGEITTKTPLSYLLANARKTKIGCKFGKIAR
jgi:ribonuclease T2